MIPLTLTLSRKGRGNRRGGGSDMIQQIFYKRSSAHEIHFNRGGVEDAEVLPFVYLFRHIGKGLVDISYHLRINSHFDIEGNIFFDGKMVLLKKVIDLFKEVITDTERQIAKIAF